MDKKTLQNRISAALHNIELELSELEKVQKLVFKDAPEESASEQKYDHAVGLLRDGVFELDPFTRGA